MTANHFIQAICSKLGELFPDCRVSTDGTHTDAEQNAFVRCVRQRHVKHLDRRRGRSYGFEVVYYRSDNDALAYNAWAETVLLELETLEVNSRAYSMASILAERGEDGLLHITFDLSLTALLDASSGQPMEALSLTEEVKS